jgi:hypothetical protein
MNSFEKYIINTFFKRYVTSKAAPDKRMSISLKRLYPEFETLSPEKKHSILISAERLEKREIIKLTWQKHHGRIMLKKLECINKEALFRLAERPFPKTTAKKIKEAAKNITIFNNSPNYQNLINFISENLTLTEIVRGIDESAFTDFVKLLKTIRDDSRKPYDYIYLNSPYHFFNGLTPRALSINLYNDSKRIDELERLFSRILNRAKRNSIYIPDLSFVSRSFPEVLVSGRIIMHFNKQIDPLITSTGIIIGLSLESITRIRNISVVPSGKKTSKPTVLTIENKETFYTLASRKKYSCLLFTGGYPNRAVISLIKALSSAGFDFFHAGDIDPDGILILQELQKNTNKPISPVGMNADTFNKYRRHGIELKQSAINNIRLIKDNIRSINGIQDLLFLIESTGLGIEQEYIDYDHI